MGCVLHPPSENTYFSTSLPYTWLATTESIYIMLNDSVAKDVQYNQELADLCGWLVKRARRGGGNSPSPIAPPVLSHIGHPLAQNSLTIIE